jgi:hypothetical protein
MSYAEAEDESQQERLTDLEHLDELNRMVNRLWGLNAAIAGLNSDDDFDASGVWQLADDICDQMEACAEAFKAETLLRKARRVSIAELSIN